MLVAIWNTLTTGAFYDDPGADFFTRRDPARTKSRAIEQLTKLGYTVSLEPLAKTG